MMVKGFKLRWHGHGFAVDPGAWSVLCRVQKPAWLVFGRSPESSPSSYLVRGELHARTERWIELQSQSVAMTTMMATITCAGKPSAYATACAAALPDAASDDGEDHRDLAGLHSYYRLQKPKPC